MVPHVFGIIPGSRLWSVRFASRLWSNRLRESIEDGMLCTTALGDIWVFRIGLFGEIVAILGIDWPQDARR